MGPRLVVAGIGGGGCNATLAAAHTYSQSIAGLPAEYQAERREAVRFVLMDTNDRSRNNRLAEFKTLNLRGASVRLGPRRTKGYGAGQDYQVGLEAMLESIQDGSVAEAVADAEIVIPIAGMGNGATGLGGLFPLSNYIWTQYRILTLPVITTASFTRHEVQAERNRVIQKEIRRFYDAGFTLMRTSTDALFESDLSFNEVYPQLDERLAVPFSGLLRILSDPDVFDWSDLIQLLYNPTRGRKHLFMAGVQLTHGQANDQPLLEQAISHTLNGPWVEFDLARAGRGALILEHNGLSAKSEGTILQGIHKFFNARTGEDYPDLQIKPVRFLGGENVTVSLILSEDTGPLRPETFPEVRRLEPEAQIIAPRLPVRKEPAAQRETRQHVEAVQQSLPALAASVSESVPAPAPPTIQTRYTTTYPTLRELLITAMRKNPHQGEARYLLRYEGILAWQGSIPIVADMERREGKYPLLQFDLGGKRWVDDVIANIQNLWEAHKYLEGNRYSEDFETLLLHALSFLYQQEIMLPRYLANDLTRRIEIPTDLSCENVHNWEHVGRIRGLPEYKENLVHLRIGFQSLFGFERIDQFVEPPDTRSVLERCKEAPMQISRSIWSSVNRPIFKRRGQTDEEDFTLAGAHNGDGNHRSR